MVFRKRMKLYQPEFHTLIMLLLQQKLVQKLSQKKVQKKLLHQVLQKQSAKYALGLPELQLLL